MSSRSKFINLSTVFMLLCIPSFTHAQSDDNAFALEIFQQAVADDSCEMYQIVIDDYPETTAAKLAKIKLRTCGGAAVVEPEPEPEDPPIDEPAPGDPGFEHLDDENRLSCNGFWNGARCIKNRRELVRNLQ
ncbi:MAG: tetratricopeptide repeat protein, partial [Alphaproteobacteria bacterium]